MSLSFYNTLITYRLHLSSISALVDVISAGGLPKCKSILLGDNTASKFTVRTVSDALKKRSK